MITAQNNQNQSVKALSSQTRRVGVTVALLLSAFSSNLNAAKSGPVGKTLTASPAPSKSIAAPARTTKSPSSSNVAKTQPRATQPAKTKPSPAQTVKTRPSNPSPANVRQAKTNAVSAGNRGKANANVRNSNTPIKQSYMPSATAGRPSLGSRRIPADRFRTSFGRTHTFVMTPAAFAGGRPHFWFGGFSFAVLGPWPAAWLATDAFYVDDIGGVYYLCNPLHPEAQLALSLADSDDFTAAPETDDSDSQPAADTDVANNNNEDASPAPISIRRGQTPAQVVAVLGNPSSIATLGAKRIYVYQDMRITFIAGRLRDVR
jgi:hypothetical protein